MLVVLVTCTSGLWAARGDLTLVDLAKPAGGYTGKCYAVTAYAGKWESDLSPAFCASGGSVAKAIRLSARHIRASYREYVRNQFNGDIVPDGALAVGFYHASAAQTFGDAMWNRVYRGAVVFDVASLANRRIVSATVRLTIGLGIVPTDTGPVISTNVTQLVAPWLRGDPNYGFVLKNSDENTGAFLNKACLTVYSDPVLEITYY